MSKSDPESAIFMEDSEGDVNVKIKKAFCPPHRVDGNPCLEYVRYLVLPSLGVFSVKRAPDNGGDKCTPYFVLLTMEGLHGVGGARGGLRERRAAPRRR
jgi:tyrosyl-tRNA synthetase